MTTSNEHNNAPAVPQGWKLVPIEPTREMLMAALDVENASYDNHQHVLTEQWKDMLAAAPVKNDYCTWLPIESVPKNGSQIILRKGNRIGAAMWVIWPATPEHEYGEGWTVGFDGNTWDGPNAPTHWTPIPHAGIATTPAPAPAAGILDRARWGGQVVNLMRLAEAADKAVASMTVPAQEAGSESKIVIDVGPGGSGGGPAEAAPPATEQTAPAPAQGEPFGYFRAEPFGWTDCAKDDEGAIALYERPQEVGLTDEEIKPDARLLAAAPELLDALVAAASGYTEFSEGDSEILRKCRSAIAKATGATHD